MPKPRRESVSVSFHHFCWRPAEENGEFRGISQTDFNALVANIKAQPALDITDPTVKQAIKMGEALPFYDLDQPTSQLLFGSFEAAYSGHAFVNSDKGKIEADSLNMRRFGFLLYLSSSGRLYVGTQYLGNYGSYGDLRSAIRTFLPNGSSTVDFAYRDDSLNIENVVTKEIQIEVSSGHSISADRVLGARRVIVLKPDNRESFSRFSRERFVSLISDPISIKKSKIKSILNELGLFSVENGEIVNGKMIVETGGGQQTLYLFDGGNFATKFPLDQVPLNEDGHSEPDPLRAAMHSALSARIISKVEAC